MVASFCAWLEREGWTVQREVEWADVVAVRAGSTLVAEAKGRTSSAGLDVDTAYGQLLRRMTTEDPGTRYAVVVPTEALNAVLRVPHRIRAQLKIDVYEVSDSGRSPQENIGRTPKHPRARDGPFAPMRSGRKPRSVGTAARRSASAALSDPLARKARRALLGSVVALESSRITGGTMSSVKISTTPEIPGYRLTGYIECCASVKSQFAKTALNKTSDSYTAAIEDLTAYAERVGGNAIVGLQVQMVPASSGGVMGDSVAALVVGTIVTVEPLIPM